MKKTFIAPITLVVLLIIIFLVIVVDYNTGYSIPNETINQWSYSWFGKGHVIKEIEKSDCPELSATVPDKYKDYILWKDYAQTYYESMTNIKKTLEEATQNYTIAPPQVSEDISIDPEIPASAGITFGEAAEGIMDIYKDTQEKADQIQKDYYDNMDEETRKAMEDQLEEWRNK